MGLQKWWGIPLTLKAPTYITVGPENFWQGAATADPMPATCSFMTQVNWSLNVQYWRKVTLPLAARTRSNRLPYIVGANGFGFPTGTTNAGGTVGNHGIWGVFTTGLTAIYSLQNWVPKKLW